MSQVLAFSGGVGGAKLALGLAKILPADRLTIACNTGDDFEHLGLNISPDLDTVMYTLVGESHPQQGWGLADESWRVMSRLESLAGQSWFRLGDLDLATHLYRTEGLRSGASLSQVTRELGERLGVAQRLLPATDQTLRTMVATDQGELAFQHYFVREQCRPKVLGLRYEGADIAQPQAEIAALLRSDQLACIVLCPSNPFLSIDPILNIAGMRELLRAAKAPVVAVSPLVAGQAIKGPTAKMMNELGLPLTARSIAAHYADILDGLVIDNADADQAADVQALGIAVRSCQTVMKTIDDRTHLADEVLRFAHSLRCRPDEH